MIRQQFRRLSVSAMGSCVMFFAALGQAQGQTVPTCPERGAVVVAWHSIAANARTYALIQVPVGINQGQAIALAARCRFAGRPGYLAEFNSENADEWTKVRSRFGNTLRGQRVENIWVNARIAQDGFVRWFPHGAKPNSR